MIDTRSIIAALALVSAGTWGLSGCNKQQTDTAVPASDTPAETPPAETPPAETPPAEAAPATETPPPAEAGAPPAEPPKHS